MPANGDMINIGFIFTINNVGSHSFYNNITVFTTYRYLSINII